MNTKPETKEHKVLYGMPAGRFCFGCRTGESEALGVRVYRMDDGSVASVIHTSAAHQSFKGVVHGGIINTYMDEVLSYAAWDGENYDGVAMTVEMNTKYFAPVPTDTDIRVIGDPPEIDRRHYYIKGRVLLPDDTVAATCELHYIKLRKDDPRNRPEDEMRLDYPEERDTISY